MDSTEWFSAPTSIENDIDLFCWVSKSTKPIQAGKYGALVTRSSDGSVVRYEPVPYGWFLALKETKDHPQNFQVLFRVLTTNLLVEDNSDEEIKSIIETYTKNLHLEDSKRQQVHYSSTIRLLGAVKQSDDFYCQTENKHAFLLSILYISGSIFEHDIDLKELVKLCEDDSVEESNIQYHAEQIHNLDNSEVIDTVLVLEDKTRWDCCPEVKEKGTNLSH